MKPCLAIALVVASAAPAAAQCVDVASGRAQIAFTGVLEKRVVPGPPNGQMTKEGDRPPPIFILRLPGKICAQDGGQFADPTEMFDDVHVSSYDAQAPWDWLNAHVGLQVTLTGNVFASENAYHMAPLVMMLPQGWKPPQ